MEKAKSAESTHIERIEGGRFNCYINLKQNEETRYISLDMLQIVLTSNLLFQLGLVQLS